MLDTLINKPITPRAPAKQPKWQNMNRLQATARIKQIKENNKPNPLHKLQENIIRKLKLELANKNITVAKADKSRLW